jgi:hypothetical protein
MIMLSQSLFESGHGVCPEGFALCAVRPLVSQLESDARAGRLFEMFSRSVHSTREERIAFCFIKQARDKEPIGEFPPEATPADFNRALQLYSDMVERATVALKNRIFTLAGMVFERLVEARGEQKAHVQEVEHRPGESQETEEVAAQTAAEVVEPIDQQALLRIFHEAVKKLPGMESALTFVQKIAEWEPLLPTVPPAYGSDEWTTEAQKVAEMLKEHANQENAKVTLTDCHNMGSASNLLNEEDQPKILPFTGQADLLGSIMGTQKTQSGSQWIDKIAKIVSTVGNEFMERLIGRMSGSRSSDGQQWKKLRLPTVLAPEEMQAKVDRKPEPYCSSQEFWALPDEQPTTERDPH